MKKNWQQNNAAREEKRYESSPSFHILPLVRYCLRNHSGVRNSRRKREIHEHVGCVCFRICDAVSHRAIVYRSDTAEGDCLKALLYLLVALAFLAIVFM